MRRSRAETLFSTAMSASIALRYASRHWRYSLIASSRRKRTWLAPDNFPGDPRAGDRIAHIADEHRPPTARDGVGLRSGIPHSRRDDRAGLERTFDSIERMPRVRGHFFNWYELENLRVLDPPYVSTVDSGNFAGHLVALAQGCIGIADAPVDDRPPVETAIEAEGNSARRWEIPRSDAHGASTGARPHRGVAWVGERLLAYQSCDPRPASAGGGELELLPSPLRPRCGRVNDWRRQLPSCRTSN